MIEEGVKDFFDLYETLSQEALEGHDELDRLTSLFAPPFIYSSPTGVQIGDHSINITNLVRTRLEQNREKGQTRIEIDSIEIIIVDEVHAVPKVTWEATYVANGRTVVVKYVIGYILKVIGGEVKLFGWLTTGDQDEALRREGILLPQENKRMSL